MFHPEFRRDAFTTPDGTVSRRAAACYAHRMHAITPWLTPALLVALFVWLRLDIRDLRRELNQRIDKTEKRIDDFAKEVNRRFDEVNKRFDEVNKRFDEVNRELADLRERMAKLEGSLEGFPAG